MARCALDVEHPNFRHASNTALQDGLNKLRSTVARDHRLSGWFNHPMPGYKQYQNKIWKWDFMPEGDRSGTRKGWRLYAYVPDPKAVEPIPATAFLCYDRGEAPKGNPATHVAAALKELLAEAVEVEHTEERFRRQTNDNGETISLCYGCYGVLGPCQDVEALDRLESEHVCP